MAVETGIPVSVLMQESPRVLVTMQRYMKHRADMRNRKPPPRGMR